MVLMIRFKCKGSHVKRVECVYGLRTEFYVVLFNAIRGYNLCEKNNHSYVHQNLKGCCFLGYMYYMYDIQAATNSFADEINA